MLKMLGNLEDAKAALEAESYPLHGDASKILDAIGHGCYRTAYLINGLVYKVGCNWTNANEVITAKAILNMEWYGENNIRVPKMEILEVEYRGRVWKVAVAEYIDRGLQYEECISCYGDHYNCDCERGECPRAIYDEVLEKTGVQDMHSDNLFIHEDGTWWIIDVAG